MSNRTPMSSLAENCSRRGIIPYYELVSAAGQAHQPWFVYTCSTGTYTSTGKGTSKQVAKHQAASGVLQQMLASEGSTDHPDYDLPSSFDTVDDDDPALQNPVGKLQEVAQKNQWMPPDYNYDIPDPVTKDFICVVTMANMEERGIGRSKKTAKKTAAKNLLQTVLNHPEFLPDDMQRPSGSSTRCGAHPTGSVQDEEDARVMEDITEAHATDLRLNNPGGSVAAALQATDLDVLDEDYVVQLRALAEEQKWMIQYHELPSPSDELHLMLVEISKVKPRAIVYFGEGKTRETCKNCAAKNTLEHIRKRMPELVT